MTLFGILVAKVTLCVFFSVGLLLLCSRISPTLKEIPR